MLLTTFPNTRNISQTCTYCTTLLRTVQNCTCYAIAACISCFSFKGKLAFITDSLMLWLPKLTCTDLPPFHGVLLSQANLVPRAFSSFKMAEQRNPWPRLLKYSTNHGVFYHVTHDEMALSEVVSHVWRPCVFSAIGNSYSNGPVCFLQSETVIQTKRRHFIVFALQTSNELLEPLWLPWLGVSPIRHFEGGEGLGTRLFTGKAHAGALLIVTDCREAILGYFLQQVEIPAKCYTTFHSLIILARASKAS